MELEWQNQVKLFLQVVPSKLWEWVRDQEWEWASDWEVPVGVGSGEGVGVGSGNYTNSTVYLSLNKY